MSEDEFQLDNYDKEEEKSLENCIKTMKEMLDDRDYKEIGIEDNKWIYQKNNEEFVIIFFCYNTQLNINIMKEYIKYIEDKNIQHSIIIYKDIITPSARKIIISLNDITIELFSMKELQYNITKHRYYRPHIELSKEESKVFKSKFGLKIPILLKSDPVCRYFNFEKNSIIKVIRKDDYISYRIVKE